jgi:tetratricopeptide (TPR) repeat protein
VYIDSALNILPQGSIQYLLLSGLRDLHLRDMAGAQRAYESLIRDFDLKGQQFAIVTSTLSFIYFYTGKQDKAKEMLLRAAIADIHSCTKETLAMMNLADMLYKEGDVEKAYQYIKIAMEDADYYGARQRKTQVGAVYPIIEGKQLSMIESKRKTLLVYSLLITVCTLVVVGFSIVVYKQNKKLQKARRIISKANESLTETNHQLQDANKIKEEYIWYYFNTTAEYITKLDALKKSLDLKLMTKKLEELRFTVDSINIKKEREELYHNFDKVFLKLFPDFVTVFNSLFKEEDRIVLKEGQLLNTELRIFALIRMGIHDHERIAKILDYSVTTIYTYKTRIRNKSILPNEEFDKQIMSIRAI